MRLCFSCAPFVVAYPSQREEAFLEGHRTGFEFFGGVSRDIIYDNLRTAVKEGWGKTAKEQEKFIHFRSHYAYHSRFCNPRAGHEKGLVENLIGYIRRNFLVPVPQVQNFEELNQLLKKRCLEYVEHHRIKGRDLSVKEAYEMEKQTLLPLPFKPYETAKTLDAKVDYFSTATFETNRYSVPVWLVGKTVTVKGSALEIKVYYRGEEVAAHPRSYSHHRTIYRLEHYLPLLKARPRSVFNARPVKEAGLPAELEQYTQKLPDPHREMVRLLRMAFDYVSQVVSERNERGSIIITTKLEFATWSEIFPDSMLTAALVDRLTHNAHILNMNEQSYRLKQRMRKSGSGGGNEE